MLLKDLKWERAVGYGNQVAVVGLRDGSRVKVWSWGDGLYDVDLHRPNSSSAHERSDLDALRAQCVLHELTSNPDNPAR